jgi:hypothetical protein
MFFHTHTVCEDALFVKQYKDKICGLISDGCSSGKDSVWASNTLKHIFSHNTFDLYFLLDDTIKIAISMLKKLKEDLNLEVYHLESTAILFEYFIEDKVLYIRAFGDGSYFVNGVQHTIDENNTPDYIGHYVDSDANAIDEYLSKHPLITFENVESFSICSDGVDKISISTFKDPKRKSEELFIPVTSETQLERKWNLLKRDGWIVKDDLSIISVNNVSTPI